jgi:hypothetical protein
MSQGPALAQSGEFYIHSSIVLLRLIHKSHKSRFTSHTSQDEVCTAPFSALFAAGTTLSMRAMHHISLTRAMQCVRESTTVKLLHAAHPIKPALCSEST